MRLLSLELEKFGAFETLRIDFPARRATACRLRAERGGQIDRARRGRRLAVRRAGADAICVPLSRPIAGRRGDCRDRRPRSQILAAQGAQEHSSGRRRQSSAGRRARAVSRRAQPGCVRAFVRTRREQAARRRRRNVAGGWRCRREPYGGGIRPARTRRTPPIPRRRSRRRVRAARRQGSPLLSGARALQRGARRNSRERAPQRRMGKTQQGYRGAWPRVGPAARRAPRRRCRAVAPQPAQAHGAAPRPHS